MSEPTRVPLSSDLELWVAAVRQEAGGLPLMELRLHRRVNGELAPTGASLRFGLHLSSLLCEAIARTARRAAEIEAFRP